MVSLNAMTLLVWPQVVRKMEKRGHSLDRSRFKQLFGELCRQEESQVSDDPTSLPPHASSELVPNEALERFKWLLGLKNVYYSQR